MKASATMAVFALVVLGWRVIAGAWGERTTEAFFLVAFGLCCFASGIGLGACLQDRVWRKRMGGRHG